MSHHALKLTSALSCFFDYSVNIHITPFILLKADVKKLQRDCAESGNELKRMYNEKTAHNANKYAKEQKQLQKRQTNEVRTSQSERKERNE